MSGTMANHSAFNKNNTKIIRGIERHVKSVVMRDARVAIELDVFVAMLHVAGCCWYWVIVHCPVVFTSDFGVVIVMVTIKLAVWAVCWGGVTDENMGGDVDGGRWGQGFGISTINHQSMPLDESRNMESTYQYRDYQILGWSAGGSMALVLWNE